MSKLQAEFSQSHNDMYWKVFDLKDGFVRWNGYDDAYWWRNISIKPEWQARTMESGRTYTLNPVTGDVLVTEPINQEQPQ